MFGGGSRWAPFEAHAQRLADELETSAFGLPGSSEDEDDAGSSTGEGEAGGWRRRVLWLREQQVQGWAGREVALTGCLVEP